MPSTATTGGLGLPRLSEKRIGAFANELTSLYGRVSDRLRLKLFDAEQTDFSRWRAREQLAGIDHEIAYLNKGAKRWADKAMPDCYRIGATVASDRLDNMGVASGLNMGSRLHSNAVAVLAEDVSSDLIMGANNGLRRFAHRYVKLTQQKTLKDREITRVVAEGIIEGAPRREVSSGLLSMFEAKLKSGKMLTINGRQYDPRKYSRLVARTRTREAVTQGTINTCLGGGCDLVRVSFRAEACEVCIPFQGRVYSLTGANKDFPRLDTQPPWHPNCRHVLAPAPEEYLRARGIYDSLREFTAGGKSVTSSEAFAEAIA